MLPFGDATVAGIWCHAALLHVPRPAVPGALAEFARVLQPGGRLLLPMTGQGGTEGVNLRIRPDGRYTADLVLTPGDPAAAAKLEQLGFVAGTGGGYRLSAEGRF